MPTPSSSVIPAPAAPFGWSPRAALTALVARCSADRRVQFWTLQLAGWAGLCLVSFLSLTLWYNTVSLVYIEHTLLQAGIGLVISLAMRAAFRAVWSAAPAMRLTGFAGAVIVASLVWTAFRIETFMVLTEEDGVWSDFGGWYFASLLVMLSWALAYHGIRYYQLMLRERERAGLERLRRLTAERAAQDAQLRMLRYQLNPHFLFNTLNSVTALIETDRGEAASEMIGELSGFLRSTLRSDVPLQTTLGHEIETIGHYLAIERKRFGDRLAVTMAVTREAAAAPVPSLILQPLVENSIKHAVARSSVPTTIAIEARTTGSLLRVEVRDTGEHAGGGGQRASGIGLANVTERLSAAFGQDYALDAGPDGANGWRTVIELPVRRP